MAADNFNIPHMRYRRRPLPADDVILAETRRLLDYDRDKGGFKWIAARTPAAKPYIGRTAGGPDGSGYISVNVLTHKFKVHRLVWLWHHGETSRGMLDHINGDRTDNRIENLREATFAENMRNRARNGGLPTGVAQDKHGGFKARIQTPDGEKVYLGTFPTEAEAAAAYVGAATILHGAFALHQRTAA